MRRLEIPLERCMNCSWRYHAVCRKYPRECPGNTPQGRTHELLMECRKYPWKVYENPLQFAGDTPRDCRKYPMQAAASIPSSWCFTLGAGTHVCVPNQAGEIVHILCVSMQAQPLSTYIHRTFLLAPHSAPGLPECLCSFLFLIDIGSTILEYRS